MKNKLFQNNIIVKKSKLHGYGVYADKDMRKGERLEECYMLISDGEDKRLEDYYFDIKYKRYAMLMGYGCIYNHSDSPNADYTYDTKKKLFTFFAIKAIPQGQEIFISYGHDWFSSRGLQAKKT